MTTAAARRPPKLRAGVARTASPWPRRRRGGMRGRGDRAEDDPHGAADQGEAGSPPTGTGCGCGARWRPAPGAARSPAAFQHRDDHDVCDSDRADQQRDTAPARGTGCRARPVGVHTRAVSAFEAGRRTYLAAGFRVGCRPEVSMTVVTAVDVFGADVDLRRVAVEVEVGLAAGKPTRTEESISGARMAGLRMPST